MTLLICLQSLLKHGKNTHVFMNFSVLSNEASKLGTGIKTREQVIEGPKLRHTHKSCIFILTLKGEEVEIGLHLIEKLLLTVGGYLLANIQWFGSSTNLTFCYR